MGQVTGQWIGAHPVSYNAPRYMFSGQVYYEPAFVIEGIGAAFSDSGDSGSLVTTVDGNGDRHAVAIVIGGYGDVNAPGKSRTVALPIDTILGALGVTLVSGHNI
jgi:hypothetical protein